MSLEVAPPDEHLAAVATPVRRVAGVACVQAHVLVEVARVAERTPTDGALQRLVSGVRPHVDRESVAARVPLTAVRALVPAVPPRRRRYRPTCGFPPR